MVVAGAMAEQPDAELPDAEEETKSSLEQMLGQEAGLALAGALPHVLALTHGLALALALAPALTLAREHLACTWRLRQIAESHGIVHSVHPSASVQQSSTAQLPVPLILPKHLVLQKDPHLVVLETQKLAGCAQQKHSQTQHGDVVVSPILVADKCHAVPSLGGAAKREAEVQPLALQDLSVPRLLSAVRSVFPMLAEAEH